MATGVSLLDMKNLESLLKSSRGALGFAEAELNRIEREFFEMAVRYERTGELDFEKLQDVLRTLFETIYIKASIDRPKINWKALLISLIPYIGPIIKGDMERAYAHEIFHRKFPDPGRGGDIVGWPRFVEGAISYGEVSKILGDAEKYWPGDAGGYYDPTTGKSVVDTYSPVYTASESLKFVEGFIKFMPIAIGIAAALHFALSRGKKDKFLEKWSMLAYNVSEFVRRTFREKFGESVLREYEGDINAISDFAATLAGKINRINRKTKLIYAVFAVAAPLVTLLVYKALSPVLGANAEFVAKMDAWTKDVKTIQENAYNIVYLWKKYAVKIVEEWGRNVPMYLLAGSTGFFIERVGAMVSTVYRAKAVGKIMEYAARRVPEIAEAYARLLEEILVKPPVTS